MNLLPKFREYLFSQSKPSSKVTVKNYISDISRFIKWFEKTITSFSPDLVTPQIIIQFKSSNELAPSSMERNVSSLRKFFHFLKLEGHIDHSPFEQLAISNKPSAEQDPYRLTDFKNYLYVYDASKLTIKNYLMDIKGFFRWMEGVTGAENAWDIKEKDILGRVDNQIIEEYKRRLPYAPRTINRKLSSLRKYLKWAADEGLISQAPESVQGMENIRIRSRWKRTEVKAKQSKEQTQTVYSSFPPLRLIQKTLRAIVFIPEFMLINPLASAIRAAEHIIWKVQGKPVFEQLKEKAEAKLKIKNLPKEVFAPFAISISQLPLHRKLIFHLAHTRPKWYKRYHQYSLSHYLHLGILVVFMSALGFGTYQNFLSPKTQGVLGFANPQIPPRILSFQGRLTDSSDNPITSSTDLRFGLYDSPTGTGSALLWQEVNTVTPDSDGIFALLLGNKSTMQQSLFAERAGLWLGVSVGQTAELTPRQRLATVAYAENADNLQGLPPITQSGAGTTNVVLALDSSGNLTIGGSATPTFQATGGQFTLSGNPLLLTTSGTSDSNVKINPGGRSFIDLQKPVQNSTLNNNVTTAAGAVEFDDLVAILATSSGQSALTINQNDAGPLLSASSSGTAKFTVANSGATTIADDLAVNGGDITSTQTTFNLLNSTVTTLNIGGAATTINLGASSGTTTTANSLSILGNTTLGDAASDTISFTGSINSNVVPDANNTRNIGSSSLRFNTVYATNGDFTNISGTVTGGSTTSSSWTINSDNATANAEVASLAFETGTATFNAALQWNASGDAGRVSGFDNTNLFNFPIGIYSQVSGGNQTFTSGTLFKYSQPAAHAITQSGAFVGDDIDFSSNMTVPNSSSGNQTGSKITLKDGGASATAIGYQTAGTLDYGIDLGGTIGTAEIRLSNGETIANTTDGTLALTATTTTVSGNLAVGGAFTPIGTLNIQSADSGVSSASTAADELVIEGSSNTGISILTPNTATGQIRFGDPQDNGAGTISYDHSTNKMGFTTNGANTGLHINSSGNVGIGSSSPDSNRLLVMDTTNQGTPLFVWGANTGTSVGIYRQLAILNQDTSANTQGGLAISHYNASSAIKDAATINASLSSVTAGSEDGYLTFSTMDGGSSAEKVRINDVGNIGIGTSSPDRQGLGGTHKVVTVEAGSGSVSSLELLGVANLAGNNAARINLGRVGSAGGSVTAYANLSGNIGNGEGGGDTTSAFLDLNTYNAGVGTLALRLKGNGAVSVPVLEAAAATTVCRDSNNDLSTCSSSSKFKDNILYLTSGDVNDILNQISNAKIASFTYKTDRPDFTRYGLIAEEAPLSLRFIDEHGNNNLDFYSAQLGYTWAGIQALNKKLSAIFKTTCVQSKSSSEFGLVKNICSQTTLEKIAGSTNYTVKNYLGEVVTGGQILAEAVIGSLRAGLIETKELVADKIIVNNEIISPITEVQIVKTNIITPLGSDKIVIKSKETETSVYPKPILEVQNSSGSAVASIDTSGNLSTSGSATFGGDLKAKEVYTDSLETEEATVSGTLRAKNLVAENIEGALLNLKSSILNLTDQSASSSAVDIASYSAQLANVDTLNAQVGTFMTGLFAVGPTTLSDATVFGQLAVGGSLILAENSVNVLGSNLEIQPLGQGGVSFLAGKIIIDFSGNLEVNGDARFNGTLFAQTLSPIPGSDLVINLLNKNASESAQFKVVNASGSAVATIDNKGNALFNKLNLNIVSPALALSESELIATGSAGVATASAQLKEVTIRNILVTDKSLIYITPVGTASTQVPYLLRQTPEDESLNSKGSFTVGTQTENAGPTTFNWLIIN